MATVHAAHFDPVYPVDCHCSLTLSLTTQALSKPLQAFGAPNRSLVTGVVVSHLSCSLASHQNLHFSLNIAPIFNRPVPLEPPLHRGDTNTSFPWFRVLPGLRRLSRRRRSFPAAHCLHTNQDTPTSLPNRSKREKSSLYCLCSRLF